MNVTLWIVLAFVLGLVFGRLTARGGGSHTGAGSELQPGAAPSRNQQRPAVAPYGDPSGPYRLVLLQSGPNKINTIKAIREVVSTDLRTAKELADNAPTELIRLTSLEQAQAVQQRFAGLAPTRIDGPQGSSAAGLQV